jgi:hypothetical protein
MISIPGMSILKFEFNGFHQSLSSLKNNIRIAFFFSEGETIWATLICLIVIV